MLVSHLSDAEIDIVISFLGDLDVFFWWFCGDRRMNRLIEATRSLRLVFPPQYYKQWPSSFLSGFKSLCSLSVSSIPYVTTSRIDWESMSRGLKSLNLDFRNCLDWFAYEGALSELLPSLEVFIAKGCSPSGAKLGKLPPHLNTLSIEFREVLYVGRAVHEDDNFPDEGPCDLLIDTPLPSSLTTLNILGYLSCVLPSRMTWPPHLQDLRLEVSYNTTSQLGSFPPSLTVLHLFISLLQSSYKLRKRRRPDDDASSPPIWKLIPESVTDLCISHSNGNISWPSPEDLSSSLRRLQFSIGRNPLRIGEYWERMPLLVQGSALRYRNFNVVRPGDDLSKFPRHMSSIDFANGMKVEDIQDLIASMHNLRELIFPQTISNASTLQIPGSVTCLILPKGEVGIKLPTSLTHLKIVCGWLPSSFSIPGRLYLNMDKNLFLPNCLTKFEANIYSFRSVQSGFRVLPQTLQSLELCHAKKPSTMDYNGNLHCHDLPRSLTSLKITCKSLPLWCTDIPSCPNLSASLKCLKVNVERVDRLLPSLGPWVPPPHRSRPFPYLVTLTMPMWSVDPNFWKTFPQRILYLALNCFYDSFKAFSDELLYSLPSSLVTVDIDRQGRGGSITLVPYQGYERYGMSDGDDEDCDESAGSDNEEDIDEAVDAENGDMEDIEDQEGDEDDGDDQEEEDDDGDEDDGDDQEEDDDDDELADNGESRKSELVEDDNEHQNNAVQTETLRVGGLRRNGAMRLTSSLEELVPQSKVPKLAERDNPSNWSASNLID
jgi:hypothetical protein